MKSQKNLDISILLDYYGNMLTDKQRTFVGHYYNNDLSLSEIAENEGITRQGVRDAIKRAEALLTEMEERLHFVERHRAAEAAAEQIRAAATEVSEFNLHYGGSREIQERAQQIFELTSELI